MPDRSTGVFKKACEIRVALEHYSVSPQSHSYTPLIGDKMFFDVATSYLISRTSGLSDGHMTENSVSQNHPAPIGKSWQARALLADTCFIRIFGIPSAVVGLYRSIHRWNFCCLQCSYLSKPLPFAEEHSQCFPTDAWAGRIALRSLIIRLARNTTSRSRRTYFPQILKPTIQHLFCVILASNSGYRGDAESVDGGGLRDPDIP